MENSGKTYSARERLAPALLLVIGLMSASWLTVSNDGNRQSNASVVLQDTIHKKQKSSTISRKNAIRSKDNQRDEEVVMPDGIEKDDFPFIARLNIELAKIPSMPAFNKAAMVRIPDYIYEYDSVPGKGSFFSFYDIEKFSRNFEKNFTEQFGCKKQNTELNILMIEPEEPLVEKSHLEIIRRANIDLQHTMAIQQQVEAELLARSITRQSEALAQFEVDMKQMERQLEIQVKELEVNIKKLKVNFEKELQREFIKDGYLKSGEKIHSLNWNNDGIEVNDSKIKNEHLSKYQSLSDKYFKNNFSPEFD